MLKDLGKLDQAAAHYEQVLTLNPGLFQTHIKLAHILWKQGQFERAATRLEQAIALRPDYAQAHNNLGNVLLSQGKFDEAVACYERAIALRPDLAEAHNNLGAALRNQGNFEQAAARCEQAIVLRPDYAEAHNSLGNVLLSQGKLDEAAACYEKAIALRPEFPEAHWNLAACRLANEDYERGWPEYEWRLRKPELAPRQRMPRWSGEPLAGRSLLLLAEQGLGDTIQFVRYARLLKERGARVVLACPATLGGLLASEADVDELSIIGSDQAPPPSDFYLPLLSAPGALATTASTIPREIPYLSADAELTAMWREELAGIDGFKIGIVWQGSPDFDLDRLRSIPLAHFAPLARLPGVRLISLQKGFGAEQIAAVDFPVLDLSGRLDEEAGPFMDTAAVIRNLDLLVTPDTAVAHLAGALGAPVWAGAPSWRPIGAGCWIATILPGIQPCGSFAKLQSASGRTFSSGLPIPSSRTARKQHNLSGLKFSFQRCHPCHSRFPTN